MSILIIARLTFQEAARRKILLAAVLMGIAFLTIYGLGIGFILREEITNPIGSVAQRSEIFNFLLMAGLYVVNFLTVAMIVLTSVDTLSGEITSGTIHTIVAKPLRRWQVVLGKWLGFAGMLTLYVLMMGGGTAALVNFIGKYQPPNLLNGLSLIWVNGLLMLSVTILGGTMLSTLANGVLVFGLFGISFVGGWIEQIGAFLQSQAAVTIGIVSSLIMPSEALWKRAAFEMRSPLASIIGFSPFTSGSSVPSRLMILYSLAYLLIALLLALRWFGRRDL